MGIISNKQKLSFVIIFLYKILPPCDTIVLYNIKGSGIYDLGTSDPVTFKYVADCIVEKYGGEIETVPFPKHLMGKYQNFTCAEKIWDNYKFIKIEDYLR